MEFQRRMRTKSVTLLAIAVLILTCGYHLVVRTKSELTERNPGVGLDELNSKVEVDERISKVEVDERNSKVEVDERISKVEVDERNSDVDAKHPKVLFKKPVCQSEENKQNPLFAGKHLGFLSVNQLYPYTDPYLTGHECVDYNSPGFSHRLTICIYAIKTDNEISQDLKVKGDFERPKVVQMMKMLDKYPDMTVVDLGSNLGVFTIPAAVKGHDVISVDALLTNHQLLHQSLVKNNVTCHVTQLHNALFNKRGEIEITIHKSVGRSSVSEQSGKNELTSRAVRAVCLDDLAPLVRGKNVYLKMDLEGSEDEALACADEFFKAANVKFVQIEWWWQRLHEIPSGFLKSYFTTHNLTPFKTMDPPSELTLESSRNWPHEVYWMKTSDH